MVDSTKVTIIALKFSYLFLLTEGISKTDISFPFVLVQNITTTINILMLRTFLCQIGPIRLLFKKIDKINYSKTMYILTCVKSNTYFKSI